MSTGLENSLESKPFEGILKIELLKKFIRDTEHKYLTTHQKLCFIIIARIYRRVLQGYSFGPIKVSNNQLIVDGNHRYIAYKLAGVEIEIVEATHSFCDIKRKFSDITLDDIQDWDANHSDTKKYCNDDFLKNEIFKR